MYHNAVHPRAVMLSQEEALALLDMCLNSSIEMEIAHEQAITKISDLVRAYMSDEVEVEQEARLHEMYAHAEYQEDREAAESSHARLLEEKSAQTGMVGILVSLRHRRANAARQSHPAIVRARILQPTQG